MRINAPHLALTLTTAALCAVAATPAAYAGNTSADVTPERVAPGEQVTVSVTCPATGSAPPTMDAHSQAFEHGTVKLHRAHHGGNQHHQSNRNGGHAPAAGVPGPQARPSNRTAPPDDKAPPRVTPPPDGTDTSYENGPGSGDGTDTGNESGDGTDTGTDDWDEGGLWDEVEAWDETGEGADAGTDTGTDPGTGTGEEPGAGHGTGQHPGQDTGHDTGPGKDTGPGAGTTGTVYRGTARVAAAKAFEGGGPNAVGPESEWAVDGTCPGDGQWKATFTVTRTAHDATHTAPAASRGVHAGRTGTFTDSPPALAAGCLLVAGALGAAVHRLRRDRGYFR